MHQHCPDFGFPEEGHHGLAQYSGQQAQSTVNELVTMGAGGQHARRGLEKSGENGDYAGKVGWARL